MKIFFYYIYISLQVFIWLNYSSDDFTMFIKIMKLILYVISLNLSSTTFYIITKMSRTFYPNNSKIYFFLKFKSNIFALFLLIHPVLKFFKFHPKQIYFALESFFQIMKYFIDNCIWFFIKYRFNKDLP